MLIKIFGTQVSIAHVLYSWIGLGIFRIGVNHDRHNLIFQVPSNRVEINATLLQNIDAYNIFNLPKN